MSESIDPSYAVTRVPVFFSERAFRDLEEFRSQFDGSPALFEGSPAVFALNEVIRKGFPVPAVGPRGADMPGERVRQRRDRAFEWEVLHPALVEPDYLLSDDDFLGDDDRKPIRPLGARLLGFYQLHRLSPDMPVQDRFVCLAVSELLRKYRGRYDPADL